MMLRAAGADAPPCPSDICPPRFTARTPPSRFLCACCPHASTAAPPRWETKATKAHRVNGEVLCCGCASRTSVAPQRQLAEQDGRGRAPRAMHAADAGPSSRLLCSRRARRPVPSDIADSTLRHAYLGPPHACFGARSCLAQSPTPGHQKRQKRAPSTRQLAARIREQQRCGKTQPQAGWSATGQRDFQRVQRPRQLHTKPAISERSGGANSH